MADAEKVSLLKKHIAPPRPVRAAGAGAIEKLLAVEFPRSADHLLELQVAVQSVGFGKLDQSAVFAALTENDLICCMSRAGSATGLIVVDPPLLSALIEIQTLGKVSGSPPSERPATKTDATMVGDIIDRWLSDAARAASEQGLTLELLTSGYARADGLLDLRAVELTLNPGQYRSLSVTMALAGDAKVGTLTLYVPASATSQDDDTDGTLGRQLRPHLLDAPVEMTAVLARASRSLDEVMALRAGDVFPVPTDQLQLVRLETCGGVFVTTARLGQIGGNRAVRPAGPDKSEQAPTSLTPAIVAALPVRQAEAAAEMPQTSAGPAADAASSVGDEIVQTDPLPDEPSPGTASD